MTSLLKCPWVVDTVLAAKLDSKPRTHPNCILLEYNGESRHGVVADGTTKINATFSEDVAAAHVGYGCPLESLIGGVMTLKTYGVYMHLSGSKQSAEFYLHVDDLAYHGGEDSTMNWSVVSVSKNVDVRERLHCLFTDWLKTNSLPADEDREVPVLPNIDANYVPMSPDYTDTPEPGTVVGDVDPGSAFLLTETQEKELERIKHPHDPTEGDDLWEDLPIEPGESLLSQSPLVDGQVFSTQEQEGARKGEWDSGNSDAHSSDLQDTLQASHPATDQAATSVWSADRLPVDNDKNGGDNPDLLIMPVDSESVGAHETVSHTPPSKKRHVDDGDEVRNNESSIYDEFMIPASQLAQLGMMMSNKNPNDADTNPTSIPQNVLEESGLVVAFFNDRAGTNSPGVVGLEMDNLESKEPQYSVSGNASETGEIVKSDKAVEILKQLQRYNSNDADAMDEEKSKDATDVVSTALLVAAELQKSEIEEESSLSETEPPTFRLIRPVPLSSDAKGTCNEAHIPAPLTPPRAQDARTSQSASGGSLSLLLVDNKNVQGNPETVLDVGVNKVGDRDDVEGPIQLFTESEPSVCEPIRVDCDPPPVILSDNEKQNIEEEAKVIVLDENSCDPEAGNIAVTCSNDTDRQAHMAKEIDRAVTIVADEMETDVLQNRTIEQASKTTDRATETTEQISESMDVDRQGSDDENNDSLPVGDVTVGDVQLENSTSVEHPLSSGNTITPYQKPKPTPPACEEEEEEDSCSTTSTISTSDQTPNSPILQRIMAYWRERHMENPIYSNVFFNLDKLRTKRAK